MSQAAAMYIPVVNMGNELIYRDATVAPEKRTQISQFSPQSTGNGAFQNGGSFVLYEISDTATHVPEWFLLDFQVQYTFTTSGTNTGLLELKPAAFLIDHIDVQLEAGVVETIYPGQLYQEELMNMTQEQLVNQQDTLNINATSTSIATTGAGTGSNAYEGKLISSSLTNGATGTIKYRVPFQCVFSEAVYAPSLVNRMKFKIYWTTSPFQQCKSGTTSSSFCTLSLLSTTLEVYGQQFSDSVRDNLIGRFSSAPHVARSLVRQIQTFNFTSLTGGQNYTQSMDAFTGTFTTLNAYVIETGTAVSSQPYDPLLIDTISVLTSGGQPINYSGVECPLLTNVVFSLQYPHSQALYYKNYVPFPLCTDPWMTYNDNKHSGGMSLNGRYQIRININATDSNSPALIVNAFEYAMVKQYPDGSCAIEYV